MRKLVVILQFIAIILSVLLLALVLLDAFTYVWAVNITSAISNRGLRVCFSSITDCGLLWKGLITKRKVALVLQLSTTPVIITSIAIMSLATFTRVIRKRTAIVILIITSWLVFLVLLATVILRIDRENTKFVYQTSWQMYFTIASLIVSFLIKQIIAFGGWIRPMTTMLSFEGHFQRYDYPRTSKSDKNMVFVKELDSF